MKQGEIFTTQLGVGRRTYFMDLLRCANGSMMLELKESVRSDEGYHRFKVMVFEEHFEDFFQMLEEGIAFCRQWKAEHDESKKPLKWSSTSADTSGSKSYASWSPLEDGELERCYCEGMKIREMQEYFGRSEGAIRSRIKKLELVLKYGLIRK